MKPNILVICGPTASGKTALAAALARRLGGEVVSADSMQVYRRMDIGTAKPTPDETLGVPHHMIDVADPEENYSVARYVRDAVPIVDDILARGKLPIVAGGTGLYIDHLIAGRQFAPFAPDSGLREQLQAQARTEGLPALRARLEQVDPSAAARIHPNDEKRTIRALEVWLSTGKTITQHDRESRELPNRYTPLTIALDFAQRSDLWERIGRRVDEMMAGGWRGRSGTFWPPGCPGPAPPCRPSAIRSWPPPFWRTVRLWTGRRRSSCAPGSTPSASSPGFAGTRKPIGMSGKKYQFFPPPWIFRQNLSRDVD